MALTDTTCRTSKPDPKKTIKLTDGKGLYLEVKPNGVKAWRYRFELEKKESVFAIGNYFPPKLGETEESASLRRAGGTVFGGEAHAPHGLSKPFLEEVFAEAKRQVISSHPDLKDAAFPNS